MNDNFDDRVDEPTHMLRRATEPHFAAMRMIREAIGELFGPLADLESEEAVLLRGPEPTHDAEAVIAALQRVADHLHEVKRAESP